MASQVHTRRSILRHWLAGACIAAILAAFMGTGVSADEPASQPSPAGAEFFQTKVRPIFVESCFPCHANGHHAGGLMLDTRDTLLKGGKTGPAIVPGKPEDSLLIHAVRRDGDLQMPPPKKKPKLSDEQIDILTQWVQMGAPWSASN